MPLQPKSFIPLVGILLCLLLMLMHLMCGL
jgi:hypothetical protein